MSKLAALPRTSVGKKVVMALTGGVLVLYVIGHMAGNLKAFQGAAAFNHYAEGLRTFGEPFVPRQSALWVVRGVLLVSVVLHVWAAWVLARASRAARSVPYREERSLVFSYASRTMRWGGVILLAFVIYHILHLTTGQAHTDFVAGDAYHNLVAGFRHPLVSGAYIVAMAALGLHLYHGIWSAFQTLGLNHPRWNPWRRPLAAAVAALVFVGFVAVPVAVLAGVIG